MATEARGRDGRAFAGSRRGVRRETDGKKWTERGDLDAPRVRRERGSLRYVAAGKTEKGVAVQVPRRSGRERERETREKSLRSLVRSETRLPASMVVVSLCDHPESGVQFRE